LAAFRYGELSGGGPPSHLKEKDVNTNRISKAVGTALDFIKPPSMTWDQVG